MVGLPARGKLSCMICVLVGINAQVSLGQIFARFAPDGVVEGNAACGMRACPPKVLTYGFYHEHWRRWPGDSTGVLGTDLTPFVVPDRSAPTGEIPDSRDEASQILRQRKPVPANPKDADTPTPGQGATSSGGEADQTPLIPSDALEPGASDVPFPLPTDPTLSPEPGPAGGDLPSFTEPQDALPDLGPSADPQPQDTPAGSEDLLDLDSLDFGRIDDASISPLAGAAWLHQPSPPTGVARVSHLAELPKAGPIGRVSAKEQTRKNPLRPRVKAQYASRRTVRTAPPLNSPSPANDQRQRPQEGRANPLRSH